MIILNGEKDADRRWMYIKLAIENKWNKRFLMEQIKENAADHYGVLPTKFGVTIKNIREAIKALNVFKVSYGKNDFGVLPAVFLQGFRGTNPVSSASEHT